MRADLTPAEMAAIARGFDDPVAFIEVALGSKLWPKQREIAYAVRHHRRVAVKACNASGKSYLIGRLIAWWAAKYPREGKIIITAAGWQQVQNIAGMEYANAIRDAKVKLPELNAKAEAKDDEGRPVVIGMAPKNATRMQGHHAGHILIIVDEAAGEDIQWDAIEGNLAGGNAHLVLLGNPTISSGFFYDAFQGKSGFHCITIDAFDTPNLEGWTLEHLQALPADLSIDNPVFEDAEEPFPGLTKRYWVYEKYQQWGENSPQWQSRVRGEFPDQAEDAVFPMAWLRKAEKREPFINNELIRAGIDVAGDGPDETVCYLVRGGNIQGFKAWHGRDAKGEVQAYLAPHKTSLENVAVDTIGPGMYFPDLLEKDGFPVQRVNVGSDDMRNAGTFFNRKAEIYWNVRTLFKDGLIAGLTDETTIQQLAGIRYFETESGKIQIEPKGKAKKRGFKSPDRAEALILALADTEPSILKYYRAQAQELARDEGIAAPNARTDPPIKPTFSPTNNPYVRAVNKLTGAVNSCNHCHQPFVQGESKIEQGLYAFHKQCAIQRGIV